KVELAWRDDTALRLPAVIDLFSSTALNRDLYLWLAALAVADTVAEAPWFAWNQWLTMETLTAFPGIEPCYRALVAAHLAQRPDPSRLPPDEARQEEAIRLALRAPGSVEHLPTARRPPSPVPLWLHPSPPMAEGGAAGGDADGERRSGGKGEDLGDGRRRQAERTESPREDRGLVTIRMENIFSWGELTKVDRGTDSDDDLEQARDVADDMERMSVSRDGKSAKGRLRFDLDLPSEEADDLVIGEGVRLPEWDYKKGRLLEDHCRILPMVAADAETCILPQHLRRTAKKLRAQFQQLAPGRVWHRAQPDGSEIDIDAYLRFASDRAAGSHPAGDTLYRDLKTGARDLACLLLADLSLSTDTYVNNHQRVIDVIRDALFLFSESLSATGDAFAIHGFSSRKRDPIRFHHVKTFKEAYGGGIRGRIAAIKPGYYTRMGAAIRHSTTLLKEQPATRRLLLILTDGKPNDLDKYEGRYGIEDTRHAVQEARRLGLQPFCVTIDEKGNDYLPHLFGSGGYVVIRRPQELPRRLPLLYARLTR
ncbi:MAG TPA: VWA domain-containing protein, partial [Chromatiales bacterium]|nr:VWA domain-containing protein [Chromatiales bacterium]